MKKKVIICDDGSRLTNLDKYKERSSLEDLELVLRKTITEIAPDEFEDCILLSWHISNCSDSFQSHGREVGVVKRLWKEFPGLLVMHSGGGLEETLFRGKELGIIEDSFHLKEYDVDPSSNRGLLHWYDVEKVIYKLSEGAILDSKELIAELVRSLLSPQELGTHLLPLDILIQGAMLLYKRGEEEKVLEGWFDVAEESVKELFKGCDDIESFEKKYFSGLSPDVKVSCRSKLFPCGCSTELYTLATLVSEGESGRAKVIGVASSSDFLAVAHKQYVELARTVCAQIS